MKLHKIAIMALSSALLLTGCQAHESAEKIKEKLEEKEYTVSIYNSEEYEQLEIAETIVVFIGLEHHLEATNSDKTSVVVAWHFDDIEQASSFFDFNSDKILDFAKSLGDIGKDTTVGTKNNVAYAGSKDACKIAGYSNIF